MAERQDHLTVVAELYKLNIYSSPSSRFRAHVDTPQSDNQFGSLVVCLPHNHQGGQLRVSHLGKDQTYDWSSDDADTVGWAAFYSDCTHEVLEVTSGHRITLTYNLFVRESQGSLLRSRPVASRESYPLLDLVDSLLSDNHFPNEGGTLGFFCAHFYAHSQSNASKRLPFALKGRDVIIFSVFRQAGLKIMLKPILDHEEEDSENSDTNSEKTSGPFRMVGKRFWPVKMTEEGGDEDMETAEVIKNNWPFKVGRNIHWVNDGRESPTDLALVHMTYGNQPGLAWRYSSVVMLVSVPSYSKRCQAPEKDIEEEDKGTEDASHVKQNPRPTAFNDFEAYMSANKRQRREALKSYSLKC